MIDVPVLVPIDAAVAHLRESTDVAATEADIQAKLDQATAFVLRACGALADATWTESTVPAPVHTAILLHLSELYADRGDDNARSSTFRDRPFGSDAVRYLTAAGYRDPVVA